jgi:hypothetical protein
MVAVPFRTSTTVEDDSYTKAALNDFFDGIDG